jgi:hypothetical protein
MQWSRGRSALAAAVILQHLSSRSCVACSMASRNERRRPVTGAPLQLLHPSCAGAHATNGVAAGLAPAPAPTTDGQRPTRRVPISDPQSLAPPPAREPLGALARWLIKWSARASDEPLGPDTPIFLPSQTGKPFPGIKAPQQTLLAQGVAAVGLTPLAGPPCRRGPVVSIRFTEQVGATVPVRTIVPIP